MKASFGLSGNAASWVVFIDNVIMSFNWNPSDFKDGIPIAADRLKMDLIAARDAWSQVMLLILMPRAEAIAANLSLHLEEL